MDDYTSEMIKDMAFAFCPQCGTAIVPNHKGRPRKFCSPECRSKLENSAVKDLSGVRQGVFLPASVRIGTKILQSGLCQPGQEEGGEQE